MTLRTVSLCVLVLAVLVSSAPRCGAQEYLPGIKWPEPKVVTPGEKNSDAPSDAIVVFDGKDLSGFRAPGGWKVEDGVLVAGKGSLTTKREFGDMQLHIEWSAPTPTRGRGQGRGNSGVYIMFHGGYQGYEVQVLDSFKNPTYFDGQAGSVYKQQPPMVNAMRPPGEWNTYDLIWTRPRFKEDGSLASPAYVTLIHNGALLQNHTELSGMTRYNGPAKYEAHADKLPFMLQDHGNPVRFRNIWVREFEKLVGVQEQEPMIRVGSKKLPYKGNEGKAGQ